MDYVVETKKILISDNGKRFNEGQDIAFSILNKETNIHEKYIGNIYRIYDDCIIIDNIEVNRGYIDGSMAIGFKEIEPNSCNYVSVS